MTTVAVAHRSVEPITLLVTGSDSLGLTGLVNVEIRMYRRSDGFFFDWGDDTFKAAGHGSLEVTLTEVDATNSPGYYQLASANHLLGLDLSLAGFDTRNETYVITPVEVALRFTGPIELDVRPYVDNPVAEETAAAVGSTAIAVRTALTQANGFWDDVQVVVVNALGAVARNVVAYLNTNGELTLDQVLPFTPAIGDPVLLLRRAAPASAVSAQDWSAGERNEIRGALGIGGGATPPTAVGHLQDIRTPVQANLNATVASRAVPGDAMTLTPAADSSIAARVFNQALPGVHAAGTAGERIATTDDTVGTNLNATVSSRSSHSAGDAADAVWDELRAGHVVAGSFGESIRLDAAGLETDAAEEIRDAILAATIDGAVDLELAMRKILGVAAGRFTRTDITATIREFAYFRQDDSTALLTLRIEAGDGNDRTRPSG